jgi:hypothetical protein
MARITALCLSLLFTSLPLFAGNDGKQREKSIGKDVEDPDVVSAFRTYWNAFDQYEDKLVQTGKGKYQQSWNRLRGEESKMHAQHSSGQLEKLRAAAQKYKKQIEQHEDVDNRPYVMLNLAQILNLIGINLQSTDQAAGAYSFDEALTVLADLERSFPGFDQRDAALYLRALIYESRDQEDQAVESWKILASVAKSSVYGVYASLAVGDHHFKNEQPAKALIKYKAALDLLGKTDSPRQAQEKIRIQYRIAWAAYRAGDLDAVIPAANELLSPGQPNKDLGQRDLIQKDASELIGDALFENGDQRRMREILSRKELLEFAPAIGLRIVERYSAAEIFDPLTEIGEFLAEEFPLALAAPRILNHLALGYQKVDKPTKRIAALEKLSLLLPKDSLWRSRYRDRFQEIKKMEELALTAAKLVAAWHYDKGLGSGSEKSFKTAEAFYAILVDFDPTGTETAKWRLRQGHSSYFTGKLDDASRIYTSMKEEFKISDPELQVASYQLVLTAEKIWRQAFSDAMNRGEDPLVDDVAIKGLDELQRVVDDFANRFPTQSRSVDVLLVGASALRDQGKLQAASKTWQRVLLSNPNLVQRTTAIRGMIFAAIKDGTSAEVVTAVTRFLKLENWNALGVGLGKELESTLSIATLDEGKKLNQDGHLVEAGNLLVGIAKDFPKIPNRARIYRDGAYLLAISGEWSAASKAADAFLKSDIKELRGDLVYLLGRANEFQIRFKDAASAYLELGMKYPTHSRAAASLARAEKLAVAENLYIDAGRAARALGDRSSDQKTKFGHYERSIRHYQEAKSLTAGRKVAEIRLKASRTRAEILSSKLLLANVKFKMGEENDALDSYKKIATEADRYRESIGASSWSAIAGESYFRLGEEARAKFDDFSLSDRAGSDEANISQKSKYFAELSSSYQKASENTRAEWAAPARFRLAQSAEAFADELASLSAKSKGMTLKTQTRYEDQVKRLKELARVYHSKNISAKATNPAKYIENEWVTKSAIQLGGLDPSGAKIRHAEKLPEAVHLDLPYQWSL